MDREYKLINTPPPSTAVYLINEVVYIIYRIIDLEPALIYIINKTRRGGRGGGAAPLSL